MYSVYYSLFSLPDLHFLISHYLGAHYSPWSTVIKKKSKQFQGSDIVKIAK